MDETMLKAAEPRAVATAGAEAGGPVHERLVISSPLGPLTLTAGSGALTQIDFGAPADAPRDHAPAAPDRAPTAPHEMRDSGLPGEARAVERQRLTDLVLVEAARQLAAYFAGESSEFDLPLRPSGPRFQRAVWEASRRIPYGRTVSYGELATIVGRPGAARAVGSANRQNPLPIIIPCHRVIGADGSLTGYAGGLGVKSLLLALELRGLHA